MSKIKQFTAKVETTETVYKILFAISFTHLLNDLLQSLVPSIYPLLKQDLKLSFSQIGYITLAFQLTSSLFQPFIGLYTDKKPLPWSLPLAMLFTGIGLFCLSNAHHFFSVIASVCLIGIGSSIFHPEASRVAHLASGGKKGLAQSIFQVGGNTGSAIGPLLAAIIIIPNSQSYIKWFIIFALGGFLLLYSIGKWYFNNLDLKKQLSKSSNNINNEALSKPKIAFSIGILLLLIFSKFIYNASITNYYTFFLIEKFNISIQQSQIYLFAFLAAMAVGTILGGPLGDKYGRKRIIWISILGAAPFTIILPYLNLEWTIIFSIIIGLIISSAFSAILVFATELIPGKVGMVSGLFFGFAFGVAGIGAALLGKMADATSIYDVFILCSFLPLIGIIAALLPSSKK